MYTIGQVADMFGLPVSTLRYYDKQGLFPELERTSGIRRFGDTELEALRVIECLKKAGMEIKDIRLFMEWCAEGPSTYPKRKAMFEERKAHMESEIANRCAYAYGNNGNWLLSLRFDTVEYRPMLFRRRHRAKPSAK